MSGTNNEALEWSNGSSLSSSESNPSSCKLFWNVVIFILDQNLIHIQSSLYIRAVVLNKRVATLRLRSTALHRVMLTNDVSMSLFSMPCFPNGDPIRKSNFFPESKIPLESETPSGSFEIFSGSEIVTVSKMRLVGLSGLFVSDPFS